MNTQDRNKLVNLVEACTLSGVAITEANMSRDIAGVAIASIKLNTALAEVVAFSENFERKA